LRAIVEAMLPEGRPALNATATSSVRNDVVAFVAGQILMLPRRLRLAFTLGLAVFGAWVRLRRIQGFAAQPPAVRTALIDAWSFGEWGPGRKLFRLIRSTALLAFYEHPLVTAQLSVAGQTQLHTIDRGEP
jgi:hypothetical protein